MGWLMAGLFVATFTAIVAGVRELERGARRVALRALREAAATFQLQQEPRLSWRSARVFRGKAQGFNITWRLSVPRRVKRTIELRRTRFDTRTPS